MTKTKETLMLLCIRSLSTAIEALHEIQKAGKADKHTEQAIRAIDDVIDLWN